MPLPRPEPCTIRTVLMAFSDYLSGKAVDSPRLSADLICMHVLGTDRLRLITESDRPVSVEQWSVMRELVLRRGTGEPAAYLLGTREFYGREFMVSPHTLIPRPETEHIIDAVVARSSQHTPLTFADLGTGSGCLAVTLATELPHAQGIAVDISPGALSVASANARKHGVANRITCVRGSFLTPLFRASTLDCLVTNPPYVSRKEYSSLSHEVRDFEPESALVPGPRGVEHALALIPLAADWLRPGGCFLMEMGYTQGEFLLRQLTATPQTWRAAHILRDLAGLDRILYAERV